MRVKFGGLGMGGLATFLAPGRAEACGGCFDEAVSTVFAGVRPVLLALSVYALTALALAVLGRKSPFRLHRWLPAAAAIQFVPVSLVFAGGVAPSTVLAAALLLAATLVRVRDLRRLPDPGRRERGTVALGAAFSVFALGASVWGITEAQRPERWASMLDVGRGRQALGRLAAAPEGPALACDALTRTLSTDEAARPKPRGTGLWLELLARTTPNACTDLVADLASPRAEPEIAAAALWLLSLAEPDRAARAARSALEEPHPAELRGAAAAVLLHAGDPAGCAGADALLEPRSMGRHGPGSRRAEWVREALELVEARCPRPATDDGE